MAEVPAWADALLSSAIRRHRHSAGRLRAVLSHFEAELQHAPTPECREGFEHVITGLKAHIAQLDLPLERERGP